MKIPFEIFSTLTMKFPSNIQFVTLLVHGRLLNFYTHLTLLFFSTPFPLSIYIHRDLAFYPNLLILLPNLIISHHPTKYTNYHGLQKSQLYNSPTKHLITFNSSLYFDNHKQYKHNLQSLSTSRLSNDNFHFSNIPRFLVTRVLFVGLQIFAFEQNIKKEVLSN